MDNTVVRPLDVELPHLDLYISYGKNSRSAAVHQFMVLLMRVFYSDIKREQ